MIWPLSRSLKGLALIADELKLERDVLKAQQTHVLEALQMTTHELEKQRKENKALVRENAILKARLAIEDPPELPKTSAGGHSHSVYGHIGGIVAPSVTQQQIDSLMSLMKYEVENPLLKGFADPAVGPSFPGDTVKIRRLPKLGGDDESSS
jgi:hypothetical protein